MALANAHAPARRGNLWPAAAYPNATKIAEAATGQRGWNYYDNGTNTTKLYRAGWVNGAPYLDYMLVDGNGSNFTTVALDETALAYTIPATPGWVMEISCYVCVPSDVRNAFDTCGLFMEEYNDSLVYQFDQSGTDFAWSTIPKGSLARPKLVTKQYTVTAGGATRIIAGVRLDVTGAVAGWLTGIRIFDPAVRRVS